MADLDRTSGTFKFGYDIIETPEKKIVYSPKLKFTSGEMAFDFTCTRTTSSEDAVKRLLNTMANVVLAADTVNTMDIPGGSNESQETKH